MCSCEAVCGQAWVSRGENACRARAVAALRSRLVPPATSVGNPLCVRHTARRTLRGVQLVRKGLGAGCGEEGRCDAPQAAVDYRMRSVVCVRATAGLEG